MRYRRAPCPSARHRIQHAGGEEHGPEREQTDHGPVSLTVATHAHPDREPSLPTATPSPHHVPPSADPARLPCHSFSRTRRAGCSLNDSWENVESAAPGHVQRSLGLGTLDVGRNSTSARAGVATDEPGRSTPQKAATAARRRAPSSKTCPPTASGRRGSGWPRRDRRRNPRLI